MHVDSENLLVIVLISSRRVSATVAWLGPDGSEKVVAHKQIDCMWHALSERSRRQAVADVIAIASESAGVEAFSAYIAMSDASIDSLITMGWADLGQEMQLTQSEREQALVRARSHPLGEERELLHAIPVHWSVRSRGGEREVDDPVGAHGSRVTGHVLLVTARAGYRQELSGLLDHSALALDGVIAPPVALWHGICGRLKQRGSTVVIDCGARHTTILVHRKGHLTHLRTHGFGGEALTQRIAQELNIPRDAAEELKKELDIAMQPGAASEADGQLYLWRDVQERHRLVAPAARICGTLVREFFVARAQELRDQELIGQVGQVHLVGRASALGGLPAFLRDIFDLPVVLGTGQRDRDPSAELVDLLISGVVRCAALERRQQLGRPLMGPVRRLFGWLGHPLE
ncbi:MAG: pilus assembly protein PilM [Planctomycetes bacterium]|nr:pilus assembly protein PilM [Planctomycetota bacterium]